MQGSKVTRVTQCRGRISAIPRKRNQGDKYIGVRRVLSVRSFEQRHCLIGRTG